MLQECRNDLSTNPKYRDQNVPGRGRHEMNYVHVHRLNQRINNYYDAFVADAPDGWDADGFLRDNVPISIAVRYGQNQEICRSTMLNEEAGHWDRLHHYENIRTMTVALATHIK